MGLPAWRAKKKRGIERADIPRLSNYRDEAISAEAGRSAGDGADLGRFDVVIVGAGTAGCLLANRLSADPNLCVALPDAGGNDN